jgi:hypothetical protein
VRATSGEVAGTDAVEASVASVLRIVLASAPSAARRRKKAAT